MDASRAIEQPAGPAPDVYRGSIPDAVNAFDLRPKSPDHTTTQLLTLLQQSMPAGVPLDQATIRRGVLHFPVAGYTWYSDDFGAPRYIPYFHLHEGNDLFSTSGTQVVAVADGVIQRLMNGTIGGVSIWLQGNDGTVYYYGHLRAYAPNLRVGLPVRMGDFVGEIGNTGVAIGTYPHLHFEVHPQGGPPVPPKPYLDTWLTEAELHARKMISQAASVGTTARLGAARWKSLLGLLSEPLPRVSSYWAAALDPAQATHGFTDAALDRIGLVVGAATPPSGAERGVEESAPLSPAVQDGGILSGARASVVFGDYTNG
ncbi:MAG: hypothetical protein NVSMB57_15390 [Actinomycetota bacterium]